MGETLTATPPAPDTKNAAPPTGPEGKKPSVGELQDNQESKSFLSKTAEKAKNLAKRLAVWRKNNPANAKGELIELARGTFDPDTNQTVADIISKGVRPHKETDNSGSDTLAINDDPTVDDVEGKMLDTQQDPVGTQSQSQDSLNANVPAISETPQSVSDLLEKHKAELAALRKPGKLSRILPGGNSRVIDYERHRAESQSRYAEAFQEAHKEGHQQTEAVSEAVSTSTNNAGSNNAELTDSQATNAAANEQQAAEPQDETLNQVEITQLTQELSDINGDPDKLSVKGKERFLQFIKSRVAAQTVKDALQAKTENQAITEPNPADPSATTGTTPKTEVAVGGTDTDQAKETMKQLGVDQQSEAGVKLWSLIDSATPDAVKAVVREAKTIKGATSMVISYFDNYGFSLNPKNVAKFVATQVIAEMGNEPTQTSEQDLQNGLAEQTSDNNQATETKSKLRAKIKEMLFELVAALGTIALEAIKGEVKNLGSN